MVARDIQRLEVVVVPFDLGTFDRLESHAREDARDLSDRRREWMMAPEAHRTAGQRDVDALALQRCVELARREDGFTLFCHSQFVACLRRLSDADRVLERF